MHDRYPAQNPRAAWRVYDGEAVIVSPDDSTMHALNAVGTVVWQAADGATTLATLVGRVAERFDAPAELVERDVTTFVVQLTSRGLLSLNEAPGPQGPAARWLEAAVPRSGYQAPGLLSEGIFETTALACGKLPGGGAKCNSRPKAS